MTPPLLIFFGFLGLFTPWPVIALFMILYGAIWASSPDWNEWDKW